MSPPSEPPTTPPDENLEHLHVTQERTFLNPWDIDDTAPPQREPQSPQPLARSFSSPPTVTAKDKQSNKRISLRRLAKLFIICGLGLVVFVMVYSYLSIRVWPNTLVTESRDQTSFLRPSAWQQIQNKNDAIISYGNMKFDDKSSALISIMRVDQPFLTQDTSQLTSEIDETFTDEFVTKSAQCTNISSIKRTTNDRTTATTTRLKSISYSCMFGQLEYHVVLYIMIGKDDHVRLATLLATDTEWKFNADVFNQILDSIEQSPRLTLGSIN